MEDCSKPPPLPGCATYHENQCSGREVDTDPSFEDHRWFTPAKGDVGYEESFQDYSRLVGHNHVVYSADRSSATVEVITLTKDEVDLKFSFNGEMQKSNTKKFTSSDADELNVLVFGSDGSKLELQPLNFVWSAPVINSPAKFRNGQKGAIVEFFGWTHKDVEKECAFLADNGYLGAKLFPVMEQVMSGQPDNGLFNPWYFMYQPVSYRLEGRMGTREELKQTIHTCRSLGVRVYADAVVNHMVGGGNDANPNHRIDVGACNTWGNKSSSAASQGKGKSPFYTQNFAYTLGKQTNKPPSQEFPAVPYGPTDFHCESALNSWTDPVNLNAGWLSGLTDLNTEKENVQERIADYLTDLLGIGFSGVRLDAAKHIKPDDIVGILSKLRRNMGGELPVDFFTWLEVLYGGESSMLVANKDSGYNYGEYLAEALASAGFDQEDVDKVKIWNSGFPKEPTADRGTISKKRLVIQNDDHDQQNPGSSSRDMGPEGCVLVKGCDEQTHRDFEVKLFENPNGADDNSNDYPHRMVLSSFHYTGQFGPMPDGKSDCKDCTVTCEGCVGMEYVPAHDDSSTGYDSVYTRVHRDQTIIAAMNAWMNKD